MLRGRTLRDFVDGTAHVMRRRWCATGECLLTPGTGSKTAQSQNHLSKHPTTTTAESSGAFLGRRGNPFTYLGVPMHAKVDHNVLQKHYHQLQLLIHPDKQQPHAEASPSTSSPVSSSQGVDASSYANAAYDAVKNPFRRCRYLLKWLVAQEKKSDRTLTSQEEEDILFRDETRENLGATQSSSSSSQDGGVTTLSQDFLLHMMECNEVVFSYDAETANEDERKQFEDVSKAISDLDAEMEHDALEAWEKKDLKVFREVVLHWTYVYNLKQHIQQRK